MAKKRIHPIPLCVDCGVDVKHHKTLRCKDCRKVYLDKIKDQRIIEKKEYQKEWYLQNKETQNLKSSQRWNELSYTKKKEYVIRHKYNIEIEQYNKLLQEQNNKCKICEQIETEYGKLCVDHCHKTQKIRGLLCKKCNSGIGLLGDSINILEKATKYLRDYE